MRNTRELETQDLRLTLKNVIGFGKTCEEYTIKIDGTSSVSQIPVMQCGGGCAPRSMVTKPVPYTCLPSSRERVIKLYEEKVRRGDILPELRNMEKTFTSKMYLPVTCTHPGI